MRRALLVLLALVGLLAPSAGAASPRPLYDVGVFARVPAPGQPEGLVVSRDGTVHVGTHNYQRGDALAPSKVFSYRPDGTLRRSYTVTPASPNHGLVGMAEDGRGALYLLDHDPSRMLRLDPRTGRTTVYATFADLRPCLPGQTTPCSAAVSDQPAFADYIVFAPDGTAYVSDISQATVWRVPAGGGAAQVWLTDRRLDSYFGPNGLQFLPDGRTLLLAQTTAVPGVDGTAAGTGKIYRLPVRRDGRPGPLSLFWEGSTLDAPDGFAIGRSGRVYVALAGANALLVLDGRGREVQRVTAPGRDGRGTVAWDSPASVAFLGTSVLVTNQSYAASNRANWAVLDVEVRDRALPLHRPLLPVPR